MTKLTWKGEDGAPDAIMVGGFRLPAGKAVEVPQDLAVGFALNPFFEVGDLPPSAGAMPVTIVDEPKTPPVDDGGVKGKAKA